MSLLRFSPRPLLLVLGLWIVRPAFAQDNAPVAPRQTTDWATTWVSWERNPANAVFAGTGGDEWDAKIRERGWILLKDGVYHLFYTGYNDAFSPLRKLGHATSKDGVTWSRDPRNPLVKETWVEDMCVTEHEGTYYMFAEGERDIAHLLTSTDLIHWEERGPLDIRLTTGDPISPGPRGTPFALRKDGRWCLFYERGDLGVWLATSDDGRTWTNVQNDPVLAMGPGEYDRFAVALNQVIPGEDGWYYGIYHANAHRPWREWTTCLARSRDLIHWEKSPANPVIEDNRSSGIFVTGSDGRRYLYTMHPEVCRHVPAGNPERSAEAEPTTGDHR